MIKQVVVRGDERIVDELISAAGSRIPAGGGLPQAPVPTAGNPDPEDNSTYSLKERIGKIVAREERRLISEVLQKTNWNRRKAAEMLEISYRSLLYKIKDYGLNTVK